MSTVEALGQEIAELAGRLDAATHRLLPDQEGAETTNSAAEAITLAHYASPMALLRTVQPYYPWLRWIMKIGLPSFSARRLRAHLFAAAMLSVAACQDSGNDHRRAVDAASGGHGGVGGRGGAAPGGSSATGGRVGTGGAAGEVGGRGGSGGNGGSTSAVAASDASTADSGANTDDPNAKTGNGGNYGGATGGILSGGAGGKAADAGSSMGGSSSDGPSRSDAASDGPASADSGAASCYQEGIAAITQDLLRADITTLASSSFEGRKTGTAGERKTVDYIVGQLKAAGLDGVGGVYEQAFSVSGVSGSNTVAVLPGNDPGLKDEVIVVGAHHDHLGRTANTYYPGADDNASGASAVMGLGRAFAKCRGQLKRTLVFMTYGGEEQGVYGSLYYTRNPLFPVAKTMYMVNHDMIGYVAKNKLEVSWGTAFAKDTLTAACRKVSFCKLIQSDMANEQGTDSDTFAAVRVPYTGFFSGFHDCYHKTCDTADKLDMAGAADTTKLSFDLIYALASTSQGLVKAANRESVLIIDRSLRSFRDHGVAPAAR